MPKCWDISIDLSKQHQWGNNGLQQEVAREGLGKMSRLFLWGTCLLQCVGWYPEATSWADHAVHVFPCLHSKGQYIVSGSDDGSLFIWEKETTNLVRILQGDESIVNCLQPHPSYCFLATSGIDPVVRLWNPRPEVNANQPLYHFCSFFYYTIGLNLLSLKSTR
jgi:WD40 repeat protein